MADEGTPLITRNFVKHLLKGSVKSLPVLGGVLEETIFGTLEGEAAAEEAEKLRGALADIQQSLEVQSLALSQVVLQLESQTEFREEFRSVLHELAQASPGADGATVSRELERSVTLFLERHGETPDRDAADAADLDGMMVRLADTVGKNVVVRAAPQDAQPEEISRATLIKGLSGLLPDDLDAIIGSIASADQYVAPGAGTKRRAIDLVRWAESPGGPGLGTVCRTALELDSPFGSPRGG